MLQLKGGADGSPITSHSLEERRGWDSNPPGLGPCRFSRPEPSTTRPPLRGVSLREVCHRELVGQAARNRRIRDCSRGYWPRLNSGRPAVSDRGYKNRSTKLHVQVNIFHGAMARQQKALEKCARDSNGSARGPPARVSCPGRFH